MLDTQWYVAVERLVACSTLKKYNMNFYVCNIDDDDEDDSLTNFYIMDDTQCLSSSSNSAIQYKGTLSHSSVVVFVFVHDVHIQVDRARDICLLFASKHKHASVYYISHTTLYVRSLLCAMTEWLTDCLVAYWLHSERNKNHWLWIATRKDHHCVYRR